MLAGSLTAGVAVGSLLMVSTHALLFGTDVKKVRSTFLLLVGSWYGVAVISLIGDAVGWRPAFLDYSLIAIALWQGIYISRLPC